MHLVKNVDLSCPLNACWLIKYICLPRLFEGGILLWCLQSLGFQPSADVWFSERRPTQKKLKLLCGDIRFVVNGQPWHLVGWWLYIPRYFHSIQSYCKKWYGLHTTELPEELLHYHTYQMKILSLRWWVYWEWKGKERDIVSFHLLKGVLYPEKRNRGPIGMWITA